MCRVAQMWNAVGVGMFESSKSLKASYLYESDRAPLNLPTCLVCVLKLREFPITSCCDASATTSC